VPGEKNRRSGFTLVELIVVIVILGILAAIAIPALTGYISKAEDEQYKMEARDINIAMHAVLDEAWANGDFNGDSSIGYTPAYYFWGNSTATADHVGLKAFSVSNLSSVSYDGNAYALYGKVLELLGEQLVTYDQRDQVFEYIGIAAKDSGANAATADGFAIFLYTSGYESDALCILVTYKLRLTNPDAVHYGDQLPYDEDFRGLLYDGAYDDASIAYDANAGYEIYRNFFLI
jgi:prepilin-type N-terminal cleavage/methylation domain-containing protein